MACGMPVIAAAQGETERIINEAKCGICSSIGDSKMLSESIKLLSKTDLIEMRKNSREYFEKHFDKKILMNKIDKYFIK